MNFFDVRVFFQLLATAISPSLMAILVHILMKKVSFFAKLKFWPKQIIIGVIFGGFAICSFYFGVKYQSVTYNGVLIEVPGTYGSANASPLIAGLVFGWPSSIIAALIGGITRLFMYPFGINDFLRSADCITIVIASLIACLLRLTLFDNRKPKWIYGILIGLLVETIHMVMIFIVCLIQTNVNYAYGIISQSDIACAIVTSVSLMLSLFGISLIEKEKVRFAKDKKISTKIQKWMVISFFTAIISSTLLTYFAFSSKAQQDNYMDLSYNVDDVSKQIQDVDNDDQGKNIIFSLARHHRVRANGFMIIADPSLNDRVVSFPENKSFFAGDDLYLLVNGEKKYLNDFRQNDIFNCSIIDENKNIIDYLAIWKETSTRDLRQKSHKYRVLALLSYEEAYVPLGLSIRISAYLELLIFIAIYGIIYFFIKRVVISNLEKINSSLKIITGGNLNTKIDVRSNDEFSSLSDDINQTVSVLKKYIDEANARIDSELTFAKEIQYSSLPYIFPNSKDYNIFASMKTAKEVGGDFYDFFTIDENHLMFLIADVSGKGIPAAMFMMRAKTLIKSLATSNQFSLSEIAFNVNNQLYANNMAGMFVTGWFGVLDLKTGLLKYVNAGHNRPLVRLKKNKFKYLEMTKNFIFGVFNDIQYKEEKIQLEPGDEILLYTDGVTEATNSQMQLYSEERLLSFTNSLAYTDAKELINLIQEDVDTFQLGCVQADDITMLSVFYHPTPYTRKAEIKINSNIEDISKAVDFVNRILKHYKANSNTIAYVDIAIDEIISNIIADTSYNKKGTIVVKFLYNKSSAVISFIYKGKRHNILTNVKTKINKKINEYTDKDVSKLGLLFVKKSMHDLKYEYKNNQNILTIKKKMK